MQNPAAIIVARKKIPLTLQCHFTVIRSPCLNAMEKESSFFAPAHRIISGQQVDIHYPHIFQPLFQGHETARLGKGLRGERRVRHKKI